MIVHRQKNHTDKDHKLSKYLDVSPKKGWKQDAFVARYLRQEFIGNIIFNIGQIGSKNLGKQKLDMNGYLGGPYFITKGPERLKSISEEANVYK